MSVFSRSGLRFIRNKAGVYNLTTFHCVYNVSSIDTDILFAYLVTDIAKEIFLDNSRQYGNGLIKFEPNDLNKGMVVDLRLLSVDEQHFISKAFEKLQYNGSAYDDAVKILNDFFREKYTVGKIELSDFQSRLNSIAKQEPQNTATIRSKRIRQGNLLDLYDIYAQSSL